MTVPQKRLSFVEKKKSLYRTTNPQNNMSMEYKETSMKYLRGKMTKRTVNKNNFASFFFFTFFLTKFLWAERDLYLVTRLLHVRISISVSLISGDLSPFLWIARLLFISRNVWYLMPNGPGFFQPLEYYSFACSGSWQTQT